MSWKFRLLLVLAVAVAAVVWLKTPSPAGASEESSLRDAAISANQQNMTTYENGIVKIAPLNFAVTGAVRDFPTSDPDALVKRANFVDAEKKLEIRAEIERKEKGIDTDESDEAEKAREINELNVEEPRSIIPGLGAGKESVFFDPLVKKGELANAPQTMPTPSLTFDGASQVDNAAQGIGALLPPDVNGDVGPNHYVSSVNLVYKVFNKNGAVVAGPFKTSSIFTALPANDPCRTRNEGDPIVVYDSLADRWHISQFSIPGGAGNFQCMALSVTNDPTGQYYVWSYPYPNQLFNDFPKVGVWTDAYHTTFNQFNAAGTAYRGVGILSQDRAKALIGDPTAGAVYVNFGSIDITANSLLPSDIDGLVGPPTGAAEVLAETRANEFGDPTDSIRLYKWVPNFATPANSVFTVIGDVPLAAYDARDPSGRLDIEQMGGANLDSLSPRSMHRFAYRNLGSTANPVNSYVGNLTVNVSGVNPTSAATYQAGIRWYEMRRNGDVFSIRDQGTHNLTPGDGANGLNNWMGSIAQDNNGNIAIGFSQSGTNQRADIKIAGRTNNVPNSGTLNEGEALLQAAGGSQTSTSGRWGDYSAMGVDPIDDCTFWYTQEYYATTSAAGWSTRVGKFKFPGCTNAPTGTIQGTITSCGSGAPISNASVNATGGFNRISGANGTYSITVAPGTYTVSAGKAPGFLGSSQTVTIAAGQTVTANICLNGIAVINSGNVAIVTESCGLPNASPDPGEQLIVSLPVQNTGGASTANLTATVQATGGVINPGPAQNYGAIAPGGAAVAKNFGFTVNPALACGSTITLTFVITDGATNLGTVTKTYTTGVSSISLSENFDTVTPPALPAGWSSVQTVGTAINWTTTTAQASSPPNSAFANDPATISAAALVSPATVIQVADSQLSFKNFYNTEAGSTAGYDGMVLEYSTDNGTTWTDVITGGGSFVSNGYNQTISTGFSSPIAGRMAWAGNSGGFLDTVVNLPAALNGQTVKFRWLMASDSSAAAAGVWVDNVQITGARVCNTCAPTSCNFQKRFDFDGDGKADISVFRPSDGIWYILGTQNGFYGAQFGQAGDKIVPADYDGDGRTDYAVYRSGTWYILGSTSGLIGVNFGDPTDVPQPADFNGDGKAELAVWRPSNGVWYVYDTVTGQSTGIQFGANGDVPVVGDYDGDCKADYAVYRNGTWYILGSTSGLTGVIFGLSMDKPVPADYDGDGKTDVAVYRPSEGNWYRLNSGNGQFFGFQFGIAADKPVPADYDGDGKADIAVFRDGAWFIQGSTSGFTPIAFGQSMDKAAPNAYIP